MVRGGSKALPHSLTSSISQVDRCRFFVYFSNKAGGTNISVIRSEEFDRSFLKRSLFNFKSEKKLGSRFRNWIYHGYRQGR